MIESNPKGKMEVKCTLEAEFKSKFRGDIQSFLDCDLRPSALSKALVTILIALRSALSKVVTNTEDEDMASRAWCWSIERV